MKRLFTLALAILAIPSLGMGQGGTPAGGYNVGGGSSSGGITSPNAATIFLWDAKYNLPQPAKWVCDATYTNGSPTVTTPGTDRPFLSTDSFAVVFGGNATCGGNAQIGITTLTPATVGTWTTATFVNAHTITLAGNALAGCTPTGAQGGCALVWGPDHTTALQAAFNDAANNCGNLTMPAGGLIATSVVNNSTAVCPTTTGGNDIDSSMTVQGQGWNATTLFFVPGFNFSTPMFAVTNTTQIRMRLHDFQATSFTSVTAGQIGQIGFSMFFNSEFDHMSLFDFFPTTVGGNNFTALNIQGVLNAITRVHDNLMINSGFTTVKMGNADINLDNNWIQGATNCITVATGATIRLKSRGNRITLCGTNSAVIAQSGSEWDSEDDVFNAVGTSNPVVSLSGTAKFHNVQMSGAQTTGQTLVGFAGSITVIDGEANTVSAGTGTSNAITNLGTLTLRNTAVSSVGGTGLANGATGLLNVQNGNSFSNSITNVSGGVFQGQDGNGVYSGSCTGVITSGATIGLYGLGQTTATPCATTTVNLGRVMSKPGSVYALFCTATAGNQATDACTVVKNGAAQTMTCSLNAVTNCTDGAAGHVVTFVAGDILGIEVIGGAATTLAAVKGTILTN